MDAVAQDIEWLQQHLEASGTDDRWEDPTGGVLGELFTVLEDGNPVQTAELLAKLPPNRIDTIGPEGDTLLHLACLYTHEECVKLLLDQNASTSVTDEDESTVLHDAAAGGNLNIVRMIVDKQPDLIHAVDNDGDNPLHNAARGGHTEIVQFLLLEGSNPHAQNKAGDTPRETAGSDIEPGVEAALKIAEKEYKIDTKAAARTEEVAASADGDAAPKDTSRDDASDSTPPTA